MINHSILFLDIENTLIKDLSEPVIINEEKIKAIIEYFQPSEINLFTYGIDSVNDLEKVYNKKIIEHIEDNFEIKIHAVYHKQFIFNIIKSHTKITLSDDDFDCFFKKENAFLNFISAIFDEKSYANCRFCLVDDTIRDMNIFLKKNRNLLEFINPKSFNIDDHLCNF